MTLGIIECVLFMGMVGLIWVMLDILGNNCHTADKRHIASPDHLKINKMDQPIPQSPASRKQQINVFLPAALIDRLRNAVYSTGNRPLVDPVAETIDDIVTQMEKVNGEAFPQRGSPFKREHSPVQPTSPRSS